MDSIYHEKQEGSLCGQHCLNNLLQGPYFTAVDLSTLAARLDEAERETMAESGEESEDYLKFLNQPSGNMDDSGYFSVQVISSALKVWSLEMVPYSSADERVRGRDPSGMRAFICNYRDHWLTIRKLANQWFNLNSLLVKPVPISDTYLNLFLAQLTGEGYSIFVVFGDLPECAADEALKNNPINHNNRPVFQSEVHSVDSDPDLQAAVELSLSSDQQISTNYDDKELQEALKLSLQCDNSSEEDDDALLRKAINMSLQC